MKRRQQGILTGMPFMANIAIRTFVDDLGRKIYLAKPPHRIVSLAPSVTEILYAVGAADRLVAVTQFCNYPPDAALKPKIGGTRPGIESLVALKADLILTPRAFVDPGLIDKLDQLKITTYVMETKTVEDVLSHVHTVGRILDQSVGATKLVSDLRRRIQRVKERTAGLSKPRLLYVLNHDPLMTVGPGSFIHHLIELAGAENIGAATGRAYPRISMEDVLKQDPEVLVFPVGVSEGISPEQQQPWQRWRGMSTAGSRRCYQIERVLMDRPGPRIVEGLERLATLLHADAFPDVSLSPVPPSP
ncbi:MAG TPA: cobalamin-binding protein [Nitrospiraceae bacterium]|nr:cobalamin-binding protein [Nitrospiraceae bacterium]